MRGRFQTDNQSQTAPPPSHSETTNHSGIKTDSKSQTAPPPSHSETTNHSGVKTKVNFLS